jgi:hypothetical protein
MIQAQVTALCFEWQQRKLQLNHPYLIKNGGIQNNKTFRFRRLFRRRFCRRAWI